MTTQNLALDISSVKLQIASVTKLHPKASPAYPTAWGVSKEAPSCYEQQHCALSKVESSWRVTAWKLYLIKTQRSLGFMPRVWRSLFQNKNYCFVVLALHGQNQQHVICASSWEWMAGVKCWAGTRNWGTGPGSARQQHSSHARPPSASTQQHPAGEQVGLGASRTLLPISLYTKVFTCLHLEPYLILQNIRSNKSYQRQWRSFCCLKNFIILHKYMYKFFVREVKSTDLQTFSMPKKTPTTQWRYMQDPSYAMKFTSHKEQIFKQ